MTQTIIRYPADGTSTDFTVQFPLGYISREHITCRVDDEVDGLGDPIYRSLTWLSDTVVRVAGAVAAVETVFTRTTPVDMLINNYTDGAAITEMNLDASQAQSLMAIQELLDGRFSSPLATDLNVGGNKIINLAPGTNPDDSATFGQLVAMTGNAPYWAGLAQAAASNAVDDANSANNSAILAEKWATNPEDVEVTAGKYSAYHWAQKALQALSNLTAALVSFTVGSTGIVGSNVQTALEYVAANWGKLSRVNAWTKSQSSAPVALTMGTTVNVDLSLSNYFTLQIGSTNFTLANPTNAVKGTSFIIDMTQASGAPRVMTLDTDYITQDGEPIVIPTELSSNFLLYGLVDKNDKIKIALTPIWEAP